MLTKQQYKLLMFVEKTLKKTGISPSYEDMKTALGLKSKSGIYALIQALIERGFIRKLPNKARALEVVKLPDNQPAGPSPAPAPVHAAPSASVESLAARRPFLKSAMPDTGVVELPLYGKIAAGTPIEAIQHEGQMLSIPREMIGYGEHYALKVEGDSMVERGILDGDTVVIKRTNVAENGAIVVALVDGFEVTLKTLRKLGTAIALEPANPRYEIRMLAPERVIVQGRLVGLMRNY